MEPLTGRMDFEFETMSGELVGEIEKRVNDEVDADREIRVAVLPREEAFAIPDLIRTKINLLPEGISEVRTIEIVGLDLQADGGTHVARTRRSAGSRSPATRARDASTSASASKSPTEPRPDRWSRAPPSARSSARDRASASCRRGPASSAEESAELQGIELGALLRTLVVRRGEDDYLFVLVPGGRRFDWPKLRAHLGVSGLSMPDADEARAVTGYERGAITPFGAATRVAGADRRGGAGAAGGGDRRRRARRQPAPRAGRPREAPRRRSGRCVGAGHDRETVTRDVVEGVLVSPADPPMRLVAGSILALRRRHHARDQGPRAGRAPSLGRRAGWSRPAHARRPVRGLPAVEHRGVSVSVAANR